MERQLDFRSLWHVIHKNLGRILAVAVVSSAAAGATSKYLVAKTYTATATLMVVTNGQAAVDYNTLLLDLNQVQTFAQLVETQTVLSTVSRRLGGTVPSQKLSQEITSTAIPNTELFTITARGASAEGAATLANTAAIVTSDLIKSLMKSRAVRIADPAVPPLQPTSPRTVLNVVIALVLGLVAGVTWAFVRDAMDVTFHTEDQVSQVLGLPTIGVIPMIRERDRATQNKGVTRVGASTNNR